MSFVEATLRRAGLLALLLLNVPGFAAGAFGQPAAAPLAVNLNLSADALHPSYAERGWRQRTVSTDVLAGTGELATPAAYRRTIAALRQSGAEIIGTYFQGGDCWAEAASEQGYPPRALSAAELVEPDQPSPFIGPSSFPGRVEIDFSQELVRQRWAERTAWHVGQRSGCNAVYIDGLALPWAGPQYSVASGRTVSWGERLDALQRLAGQLPDMLIIANVAGAIGGWSEAELQAFCDSRCAGLSIEQPLRWRDAAGLRRSAAQIRRLAECGKRVILIPTPGPGEDAAAEEQLLAALALLSRPAADSPVQVAATFWKPEAEWEQWPARLGPPRGEPYERTFAAYSPLAGLRVTTAFWRDFAGGSLALNPTSPRSSGRLSGTAKVSWQAPATLTPPAAGAATNRTIGDTAERMSP